MGHRRAKTAGFAVAIYFGTVLLALPFTRPVFITGPWLSSWDAELWATLFLPLLAFLTTLHRERVTGRPQLFWWAVTAVMWAVAASRLLALITATVAWRFGLWPFAGNSGPQGVANLVWAAVAAGILVAVAATSRVTR